MELTWRLWFISYTTFDRFKVDASFPNNREQGRILTFLGWKVDQASGTVIKPCTIRWIWD